MYRILTVLLIFALSAGCAVVPEPVPEPEPSPIICEGGHYSVRFQDWQMCGCPSCEIYPEGTYWENKDGRMFLLGESVINPIEVFGKCPIDYIYEIEL